ncbi:MAG: biotin carboxyl carrier protein, partial [Cognaticolwellia sp.]
MPLTAPQSPSIEPERLLSPAVGTWWPAMVSGALVQPGVLLGHIDRLGARHPVHAGQAAGQISLLRGAGPVQYGEILVELGGLAVGPSTP